MRLEIVLGKSVNPAMPRNLWSFFTTRSRGRDYSRRLVVSAAASPLSLRWEPGQRATMEAAAARLGVELITGADQAIPREGAGRAQGEGEDPGRLMPVAGGRK